MILINTCSHCFDRSNNGSITVDADIPNSCSPTQHLPLRAHQIMRELVRELEGQLLWAREVGMGRIAKERLANMED